MEWRQFIQIYYFEQLAEIIDGSTLKLFLEGLF